MHMERFACFNRNPPVRPNSTPPPYYNKKWTVNKSTYVHRLKLGVILLERDVTHISGGGGVLSFAGVVFLDTINRLDRKSLRT